MKHSVALIAPPFTLEDRYGKDMKHFGAVTEPLGLAYLAGCLEEKGIDVSIIDAPAENMDIESVVQKIKDIGCSLVGVSLLTPSFGVVKKLCHQIKNSRSNITIILGGPHCTALPERTLVEIPSADIVCFGEGEHTIVQVAMDIENSGLDAINGICYRDDRGAVQKNGPRPYVENLDEIPFPARHLLPMGKYHMTASRVADESYCPTIIVARGCPFGCTYCSHTFGRKLRFHSVERVISEINFLMAEYKIHQLNIEADTLTANKKFINSLCHALIETGIAQKIKWTCESRVDTVDYNLLKLMKQAGCWQISYGFETGSQRLLDMINKSVTLEQAEETVRYTHQVGISIRGFFMLGLPSETREESMETINFAIKLNPLWSQFTITVPYPGTPMFDSLDRENKIKTYDWEHYNTWSGWKKDARIPFVAEGRTPEELIGLQKMALRKFYMRPSVFIRFLSSVRSVKDLKKYMIGLYVLLKSKIALQG